MLAIFTAGGRPPTPVIIPALSKSAGHKVFELALSNGRLAGARDTIRINKGEQIELRWSSDRPIALHLHGYDIEVSGCTGCARR